MLPHKFVQAFIAKSKTFSLKNNLLFLTARVTFRIIVFYFDFTILDHRISIHPRNVIYRNYRDRIFFQNGLNNCSISIH